MGFVRKACLPLIDGALFWCCTLCARFALTGGAAGGLALVERSARHPRAQKTRSSQCPNTRMYGIRCVHIRGGMRQCAEEGVVRVVSVGRTGCTGTRAFGARLSADSRSHRRVNKRACMRVHAMSGVRPNQGAGWGGCLSWPHEHTYCGDIRATGAPRQHRPTQPTAVIRTAAVPPVFV